MVKVRSLAVGFGISAWAMLDKYQMFFSEMDAINKLPHSSPQLHEHELFFVYYILVCLAVGLFVASFYPLFERVVVAATKFVLRPFGEVVKNLIGIKAPSVIQQQNKLAEVVSVNRTEPRESWEKIAS